MIYRLYKTSPLEQNPNAAMTIDATPCVSFLFDPANTYFIEYKKWLAEGNEPEPADATPVADTQGEQ